MLDVIARETASLLSQDEEDVDPFEDIEEDMEELEGNKVILEED